MGEEFRISAENFQKSFKELQERNDKLKEEIEEDFKIKAKSIREKFDEHKKEIESTIKQIIPDEHEVSVKQLNMSVYNLYAFTLSQSWLVSLKRKSKLTSLRFLYRKVCSNWNLT